MKTAVGAPAPAPSRDEILEAIAGMTFIQLLALAEAIYGITGRDLDIAPGEDHNTTAERSLTPVSAESGPSAPTEVPSAPSTESWDQWRDAWIPGGE